MFTPSSIIGREQETALLEDYAASGKAEFIALYGRRRVGKTFLIQNVFGNRLSFSMTGVIDGNAFAQMHAFVDALDMYGAPLDKTPDNWYAAFTALRHYLMRRITRGERCIVFIDELPCFDTPKSDFALALGYFWNSWGALQPELMLIVCGSSTSWMMSHVIDSHGGLHERITHEIHLQEFSLRETEQYLLANGFNWDRIAITQAYMAVGGIPYYLASLSKSESLAQNFDRIFFASGSEMQREFARLYSTMFTRPDPYIAIIEVLAHKHDGMTRDEIAQAIGKNANGRLTMMLKNLIDCDIIRFYRTKLKKISQRNGIYQLCDMFSLFYFQFLKNGTTDTHFWTNSLNTPALNAWTGVSFERVCMKHIQQIKNALRIDAIRTEFYSWRGTDEQSGSRAQIDLVIERADRMVNICEAKFSMREYSLSKEEYLKLQRRIGMFIEQTAYRGGVIPTMITSYPLTRNAYSEHIAAVVTLDDLFI